MSAVTGSTDGIGAYADLLAVPSIRRIPLSQQVVRGKDLHGQLRGPMVQRDRTAPVPSDEAPTPSPSEPLVTAREFERLVQHAVARYHATPRRELGDSATRFQRSVEEERLYRHIQEVVGRFGRPGDDA